MTLIEKIKKDLTTAIKARDNARKDGLRVILGEFARQDRKDLSNDEVIQILKKLLKSERELMVRSGEEVHSAFHRLLEGYLPKMASEDEIAAWIEENIDFTKFSHKMQAMKPIMEHFGSGADGHMVKTVLQKM